MNAISIRVLLCLAGCAGSAALAGEPDDLPSRELLESYSYQPLAVPDESTELTSMTVVPLIAPAPTPRKVRAHDLRDLEDAIAHEKKHRSEALFIRNLPWNKQLEVLAKPDVQVVNLPWSPMVAMDQTSNSPNDALQKLEARIPVLKLLW